MGIAGIWLISKRLNAPATPAKTGQADIFRIVPFSPRTRDEPPSFDGQFKDTIKKRPGAEPVGRVGRKSPLSVDAANYPVSAANQSVRNLPCRPKHTAARSGWWLLERAEARRQPGLTPSDRLPTTSRYEPLRARLPPGRVPSRFTPKRGVSERRLFALRQDPRVASFWIGSPFCKVLFNRDLRDLLEIAPGGRVGWNCRPIEADDTSPLSHPMERTQQGRLRVMPQRPPDGLARAD